VPQETPSPIDLPEPELDESGLGWAFGVILIASLFLLFANAASLRDWIDDRPPGPIQAQAAELAEQWVAITEGFGIGLPRKVMHAQWKRAEQARFPGQKSEGEGAGEGP
jgi:uncharacterized protein (DUF58 family)